MAEANREENDSDDESESSDEEEEFTGTWDNRCRIIAYDMQTKKQQADVYATERITELLKKNSKYISATAPSGKQLLHWAAQGGCEGAIKLLLSRGAKKDAKDINKMIPLDFAVNSGQSEPILKLLENVI